METVWAVVWWCEVGEQDVRLGYGVVVCLCSSVKTDREARWR